MKKLSLFLLSIFSIAVLLSCEKSEMGPVANTTQPGSPSITAPESGESFTLSREEPDTATAMTIKWSEPDFGFSAAPNYIVELGTAGNDFSDPEVLASGQMTSASVTVGDLNQILLAMELAGGQAHDMQIRVWASINDSVTKAISEPVPISVTPFKTDFPPIYMIGSAINGWSLDAAQVLPSIEPNIYSTRTELTNGDAFRLFTSDLEDDGWSAGIYNYQYFADNDGNIDELLVNANDDDSNFQFTGTTGWYRVTVNMDTYSVQLEEAEEPIMYMTGLAVGGWNEPGTGESVKMSYVQDGIFEATTEFSSDSDANFRFFPQAGWGPDSYNYPYFANNDGEIDELLINAEDSDENFEFTGSNGQYYIKVNINDYTVEMETAN